MTGRMCQSGICDKSRASGDGSARGASCAPSRLKRCVRVMTRMYVHPSAERMLYASKYSLTGAGGPAGRWRERMGCQAAYAARRTGLFGTRRGLVMLLDVGHERTYDGETQAVRWW